MASDGTTVIVKIASLAAKKELDYHRSDIINHFRRVLLNDDLVLDCVIEQIKSTSTAAKKIYTRKDKFEKLVSKNKYLEELKNKLGLDYDL